MSVVDYLMVRRIHSADQPAASRDGELRANRQAGHGHWSLTEARFEHGCGGTCVAQRGSCPQRRLILADGLEHVQLDGRFCLVRPKSGKPRTIPLLPQLVEALRRYLAATAQ